MIKNDIKRLAEAIGRTDKVGKSSLKGCFVTFLVRFDKDSDYVTKDDLEKQLNKKEDFVKTILIEPFRKQFDTLDFSFERHEIEVSTVEE